ncbi:MAG TPA: sulfotransferase family protein [Rhizobiales bacterium]|nr:sulfotransferase family protein [Hyphomicrobiales bacterium]
MAKNRKSKRRVSNTPVAKAVHHLPAARHRQVTEAIAASNSLISQAQYKQALELCQQLQEIEPRNAEIFLTMANAFEHAGMIEEGINAYQNAFKLLPNFVPGMVNFALMLYRSGFIEKALSGFNSVLSIEPDFLPALDGASRALSDLRRFQKAVPVFEKLARLRGTSVDMMELARMQELTGNLKAAHATCQRALATSHDKAAIEVLAGMFSLSHGDKANAAEHFNQALDYDSNCGFAHFHLAKSAGNPDQLKAIEEAINRTQGKSVANIQAPLHFARGYLLEKSGDHELAFAALKKANELVSQVKPDDNAERDALCRQHQTMFTAERIAKLLQGKTDQSKRPVFVTGLPRSGTTLVEQIIAGHSEAAGLGEVELIPLLSPSLSFEHPETFPAAAKSYRAVYPAELSGQQRIVDKSISSALLIGAIFSMFPNASVIYCDRHPMDVAWSAFKQYFNDGALAYTYSFEGIAHHQEIYARNIEHWQSVFPDRIHRVRYEDLVQMPEEGAKALISHINLPWQDACLDFYKSKTPVRTASYDQVRQPIYTSSIGGWKAYEPWLGELKTLLRDRIEQYET